jgi:hypothetical protein
LRDRLRTAANERIATHWLGDTGDPQPVMAQVIRIIDRTTETAKMSML